MVDGNTKSVRLTFDEDSTDEYVMEQIMITTSRLRESGWEVVGLTPLALEGWFKEKRLTKLLILCQK